MNKKIQVILTIVLIILFVFGLGALGIATVGEKAENIDATQEVSRLEETTTSNTEVVTTETTQPSSTDIEETTGNQISTETIMPTYPIHTPLPDVPVEKKVPINQMIIEGKTLRGYGDVDDEELLNKIRDTLALYDKDLSLAVYSLRGDKALSYNMQENYFSACTVKMGYLLSCCKIMEAKGIPLNTVLTYEEKHYHTGSGDIQFQPLGTEYTIAELIEKCLSISDNVAYEMLMDYFGTTEYNEMMRRLGCDSLYLYGLWTTEAKVRDYLKVWSAVNKYFESNSDLARLLKSSCTNTPFNYGTEELYGVDYSHKSGDNFGYYAAYHDAGIVWDKENPYIYVIFTYSEGEENDVATVNTIMNTVYEIMTK